MDWGTFLEVSSFNFQLNTCNVLCNESSDNFYVLHWLKKYWFNDSTFGMEDKEMHVIHSPCLVYCAMTLIEKNMYFQQHVWFLFIVVAFYLYEGGCYSIVVKQFSILPGAPFTNMDYI